MLTTSTIEKTALNRMSKELLRAGKGATGNMPAGTNISQWAGPDNEAARVKSVNDRFARTGLSFNPQADGFHERGAIDPKAQAAVRAKTRAPVPAGPVAQHKSLNQAFSGVESGMGPVPARPQTVTTRVQPPPPGSSPHVGVRPPMGRGKMLAAGAVGAGVLGAGALAYRHFHRQEKQASVANISEFIEKVASDVSFVDEMEKISKDVKRKEEDISHMNFFERHPKKILGGAAAGLIGGIALHRMLKGGKAKIPMAPHPPGPTMKRAPSSAPHNTSGEALKPGSSIKPNPEGLKQWRKAHRAAQVGKIKTLPEATGLFKLDHSKSSRSGSDRDSFKRSRMWRSKYKGAIKNLLPEATPETRKANSARQQKLNKRKWVEEAKNVEMDRLAEQVGRRLAERKGK